MKFMVLSSVSANRVSREMSLLTRFLAPAVAALLATGAAAVDATWINVATDAADWYVVTNWVDAGGNPLAVAPTNGEDVAFVAFTNHPFSQHISTGKTLAVSGVPYLTPTTAVDVTIGKLTGPADRTIRVPKRPAAPIPSSSVCFPWRIRTIFWVFGSRATVR